MKKFITTSPLQELESLKKLVYEAIDNEELQMEEKTRFPVIPLLNAYANENEEVELIVLCYKSYVNKYGNTKDASKRNLETLREEINELCMKKKFKCNIKEIEMDYNESIQTHLKNFEMLISKIEDKDELYACMTYGTKAIPIIEMMALNYAYRAKFDTQIKCIAYGSVVFIKEEQKHEAKIYDMTSLFYMDEIVRKVADMKLEDSLPIIHQILEL